MNRYQGWRDDGISIHALHEESDPRVKVDVQHDLRISIHALHEESDLGQGTHPQF